MSKQQEPKKRRTVADSKNRQPGKKTKKKTFLTESNMAEEPIAPRIESKKKQSEVEKAPKSVVQISPKQRWCEKVLTINLREDICREFVRNKMWTPEKKPMAHWERNEPKNRYDDIMCLDTTRVILKDRPSDNDYIHGSWMEMPDGQKYISTQGPLNSTIEDFWHMIYTEKSNVIVMLTALEDDNTNSKCARYFPIKVKESETFGPYKVTKKSSEGEPFPEVKYGILTVEKSDEKMMEVHHFIYDTWTDHFGPEIPGPAVGLLKMARKLAAGTSPITVHCSAGIGRTCTLIGIDLAYQRIQKEGDHIDMPQVMKDLRTMRYHSIQSCVQYIFIYLGVLEICADEKIISRKGRYDTFLTTYQQLLKKFKEKTKAKRSKDDYDRRNSSKKNRK